MTVFFSLLAATLIVRVSYLEYEVRRLRQAEVDVQRFAVSCHQRAVAAERERDDLRWALQGELVEMEGRR